MKTVTRRDFLKYCAGAVAALGLDFSIIGKLEKAFATGTAPKIIWLNGANCTGCTVSLANRVSSSGPTDIADLLLNYVDLAFHANLMGACGQDAVQILKDTTKGQFILAVDGGIPTAFEGRTCVLWSDAGRDITALEAVISIAPKASALLSVGTCASFGGVPAASPNPTQIRGLADITGLPVINIPGCPAHPDWIVGTIAQLLAGVNPELDSYRRPKIYFGKKIHDKCPRKGRNKAEVFGTAGYCLDRLGCKGKKTMADCPVRLWNNSANWCIGANTVCLGCTESGFPDRFSPFYRWSDD
jgi:hydrogenase small subunit